MTPGLCSSCGNSVSATARFCPRCGNTIGSTPPSAVEPQSPYAQPSEQPFYQAPPSYQQPPPSYPQPYYQPQGYGYAPSPIASPQQDYVERKDKSVAVVLAIFLGFWTWLYTYKRDAWKFWLSLALHLTLFNPLWTWLLLFLPNIALGIWAIVDVAVKPQQFYDNYPYG